MLRPRIGRVAGVFVLVGAALLAGTGPAQALPRPLDPNPPLSCIDIGGNASSPGSVEVRDVGVGVVHLADRDCATEFYDIVLQPGQDTFHDLGWREVAAVYIGPGYGARVWRDGVRQEDVPKLNRHKYHLTTDGGNYVIQPYR